MNKLLASLALTAILIGQSAHAQQHTEIQNAMRTQVVTTNSPQSTYTPIQYPAIPQHYDAISAQSSSVPEKVAVTNLLSRLSTSMRWPSFGSVMAMVGNFAFRESIRKYLKELFIDYLEDFVISQIIHENMNNEDIEGIGIILLTVQTYQIFDAIEDSIKNPKNFKKLVLFATCEHSFRKRNKKCENIGKNPYSQPDKPEPPKPTPPDSPDDPVNGGDKCKEGSPKFYKRKDLDPNQDYWQNIRNDASDIPIVAKRIHDDADFMSKLPENLRKASRADLEILLTDFKKHYMQDVHLLNIPGENIVWSHFIPYPEDAILWTRLKDSHVALDEIEKEFFSNFIYHERKEWEILRDKGGELYSEFYERMCKKPQKGLEEKLLEELGGDLTDNTIRSINSESPITPYKYAHYLSHFTGYENPDADGITEFYNELKLISGYEITPKGRKLLGMP